MPLDPHSPKTSQDDLDAEFIAFGPSADLTADLSDAFELVPNITAIRAESLPNSSYTFVDTTGEDIPLPETPLASLPVRVHRRYSATEKGEISPRAEQDAPMFAKINRDLLVDSSDDITPPVYPHALQTAHSIEELETQKSIRARSKSGKDTARKSTVQDREQIVSADPYVAALLERMGKAVTRDAKLGYEIDQEKKQQKLLKSQAQSSGAKLASADAPLLTTRRKNSADTEVVSARAVPLVRSALDTLKDVSLDEVNDADVAEVVDVSDTVPQAQVYENKKDAVPSMARRVKRSAPRVNSVTGTVAEAGLLSAYPSSDGFAPEPKVENENTLKIAKKNFTNYKSPLNQAREAFAAAQGESALPQVGEVDAKKNLN